MKYAFTAILSLCFFAASNSLAQLPTKQVLPLSVAKQIAEAAEKEAMKRSSTVVIAVVDDGGHLLVLERLDDTQVASVDVAIGKGEGRSCRDTGRNNVSALSFETISPHLEYVVTDFPCMEGRGDH